MFRAPRLGGDKFGVQRACQARHDFVLHVEEIGQRLSNLLGQWALPGFPGGCVEAG
jgi:hypothetical protein